MKVLITPRGFANYGTDIVKEMEAKGVTVHYNDTGKQYTPEQFLELAKDADGIIVGVDVMDKAMMEQCPNLKVVCKFGVGTDNIDLEYAKERGIYVGRTVGSNSKSVAEHVIAMMFMESKNLYTTVRDVKNGGHLGQFIRPSDGIEEALRIRILLIALHGCVVEDIIKRYRQVRVIHGAQGCHLIPRSLLSCRNGALHPLLASQPSSAHTRTSQSITGSIVAWFLGVKRDRFIRALW